MYLFNVYLDEVVTQYAKINLNIAFRLPIVLRIKFIHIYRSLALSYQRYH